MNRQAMTLPKKQLLMELDQRIEHKTVQKADLDSRFGDHRVRITSYMENIGWPELFGFDMNRFFTDADFAIEQQLRQLIFWADNVPDDTIPGTWMSADVGMYWDMTLFGMKIQHDANGVPQFLPHPFQQSFDPGTLGHFDFHTTGVMPRLLKMYHRMQEIIAEDYDGKINIGFPSFNRGPLDIYVQLRGYENFVDDISERPEELKATMVHLADERLRFARERAKFLGEIDLPKSTSVADDWVNIPFISPTFFRKIIVPVYAHIRQNEGPVTGFHTCGKMEPVIQNLLSVFPELRGLDVSGWNDVTLLDSVVDPAIHFGVNFINTITLGDSVDDQTAILQAIHKAHERRSVSVCAQAIVKLYPTYEETLARLGRFFERARPILSEPTATRGIA